MTATMEAFIEACNYPGRLDEATIDEALGRYLDALGIKRHIQRLWFPEPGHGGDIPSRAGHGVTRAELDRLMPQEFWREVVDRVAVEAPGHRLVALHTPGHAPNHLCFRLDGERALFTGDNVLDGMWSVISPDRGGDMATYLTSLARMRAEPARNAGVGHADILPIVRRHLLTHLDGVAPVDEDRRVLRQHHCRAADTSKEGAAAGRYGRKAFS